MPQPNDEPERLRVNAFGTQIALSGRESIMIVGLLAAIGLLIFIDIRYAEVSRKAVAEQVLASQRMMAEQEERSRTLVIEQMELNRRQYWLIFNEMRLQTGLLTLREDQRPQLVDPDKLEQNLRQHLKQTPKLEPPIYQGDPPRLDSVPDVQDP